MNWDQMIFEDENESKDKSKNIDMKVWHPILHVMVQQKITGKNVKETMDE